MCGEKLFQSPLLRLPLGSPSRVRGKAVQFHHRHNGVGITPACAGKSHVLPRPAQVQWDHPRVCGEKKKAEEMGATTTGSPPRMRGKENRVLGGILHVRITPACAGKSRRCRPATLIRRDHPRVCGEKSTEGAGTAPLKGSPPRVRGKGDWTTDHPGQTRITPACAGKSGRESGTRACCRDHPRVCGEKARQGSGLNLRLGSPPRVRGKDSVLTFIERGGRITPACAGKSALSAGSCPCSRDHPRVCGEKNNLRQAFAVQQGSPPRVRGKVN